MVQHRCHYSALALEARDIERLYFLPGVAGAVGRVCAPGSAGNCSVQGSVGNGQPGHPPVDLASGAAGDVAAAGAAAEAGGATVAGGVVASVVAGSSFLRW